MNTTTKARTVGVVLIALLIWPFVHQQLSRTYLISPWKLWGWAMYCVPSGQACSIVDRDGRPQQDLEQLDEVTRSKLFGFARWHHALGLFFEPKELAYAVARLRPHYDAFIVRMDTYGFDARSFYVVVHRVDYHCRVGPDGEISIDPTVIKLEQ